MKGNEFAMQQKYLEAVEHYTEALRRNSKDLRVSQLSSDCSTDFLTPTLELASLLEHERELQSQENFFVNKISHILPLETTFVYNSSQIWESSLHTIAWFENFVINQNTLQFSS
ncbi:TPR-like protein [Dioscorea alata]|uniref:TPR-like protein n=1 Tax=Dioscorea alata TaxID=55571 RepID=A0ACB7VXK3_DIOAL|nr:TPR-like protein [Dioscorea alata]